MTTTTAARLGAAGATDSRLRRAWKSYLAHRAYRVTLAELGALTDRELADVGLRREALKRTAREAVYGL